MKAASSIALPIPQPASAPALRSHPSKLFVETTTRCNLGCTICVKQARGNGVDEGELRPAIFAALEPAFSHLEALILNGVGEPLLHPELESFVSMARKAMPATGRICFQSNGLLLTRRRALSLIGAGLDTVCLSVDSASPEMFRSIREGGELSGVDRAFSALAFARKHGSRSGLRVGIEFVVMRSNLRELPATLRWAASRGASFAVVTHVMPYAAGHLAEAAYDCCTSEALELFASCRQEASRQGADICGYFEARWGKFARTREEEKIIELVREMKSEAERRGVFMDMKKLLRMDSRMFAEVTELFAEARAVAAETGLELRLPEATPQENRRCNFVEEGGAFVTWQGSVAPCYFLWHRYNCFAGGWEQQVQPKLFGKLQERGILEIWNDPAFRRFRDNVLAYDYPVCYGCALVPCNYVQTDEFEQDCHIKEVPCGACFWNMGVFQCLR